MKIAVLQFPGSGSDRDTVDIFRHGLGLSAELVWHKETGFGEADLVVLPGGFAFGDYLRCGAIASHSPIMQAVKDHADRGGLVLGIGNGFQILCEAGLLPGALIENVSLEFRSETVALEVENATETWKRSTLGEAIRLPVAHGKGNYQADDVLLQRLEENHQILFRYDEGNFAEKVNGSVKRIAGIRNEAGTVFGMMPHPERAMERFHPSQDGRKVIEAILQLASSR